MNLHTVKWAQCDKTHAIQRTVRTAHLSVLMTVHSFSTQYNTELIISPLTSRQTSLLFDVVQQKRGRYRWMITLHNMYHLNSVNFFFRLLANEQKS